MTLDAIFERYEVPADVQHEALLRASVALVLRDSWVGQAIDWTVLTKALVFARLGDPATSAHIRKKVGLDKYATTLIARGTQARADMIALSNDWYQLLYVYGLWRADATIHAEVPLAWGRIAERVEAQVLTDGVPAAVLTPEREHDLRAMEVYHYKNPSV